MPARDRNSPTNRSIDKAKITDYLLNDIHEDGAPKAKFFRKFGFSPDRWEAMGEALSLHPDANPVEKMQSTRWETKHVVRCSVSAPDRQNPCIYTVWMEARISEVVFVTAYPAD